jgi:hypothetical protein
MPAAHHPKDHQGRQNSLSALRASRVRRCRVATLVPQQIDTVQRIA